VRDRLARVSRAAGAKRADGSELLLRPHDCRRMFASELFEQQPAGACDRGAARASRLDTVMVYAKLYPVTLIEEYHLCALPTGDHCSRGLVCLGCSHAQPKRSAAPVLQRMLSSYERALDQARSAGEPAGQIAARELVVQRIAGAAARRRAHR
jgi:hypothetical protein